MLIHSIINLLGMKDKHVEIIDAGQKQGVFWFDIHTHVKTEKCPHCKSRSKHRFLFMMCAYWVIDRVGHEV